MNLSFGKIPRILVIDGNVPAMQALYEILQSAGASATHISANDFIDGRFGNHEVPDCVVISIACATRARGMLVDLDAQSWAATADVPQFTMLQVMQRLRHAFANRSVAIVLMGATVGLTGASRYVALATATEGQRGMMKSLARQWGPQFRLNWLAVSTPLLFPEIDELDLPEQSEFGDYIPPLSRRPTMEDVVQTVLMLGCHGSSFITGQTLTVDGGEWMFP